MNGGPSLPYTHLSLADVWDRVDPLAPALDLDPRVTGMQSLPFTELSGTDFERLCYELLVADGFSPRFFGTVGQSDYGADVLLEVGATRTVLQCKNLAARPSFGDIRAAVETFRTKWIGEAGLPPPEHFIYCCPQPLDDRLLGEQWIAYRDQVRRDGGIELSLWERTTIESRLRDRPDIVAGVFSDRYAENFCGPDRWRLDDPWTRVQWGEARHLSIRRFLERHRRDAIALARQEHERFVELLEESPVMAIRGVPGSGKTSAALGHGCRLRDPVRRIYYATLEDASEPERLWQSVRRRAHLPSLFVLDDCHRNLRHAGLIRERLAPELAGNATRLVLVLRDLPASAPGQLDDTPEWLAELEQNGAVIDLQTSLDRTRAVVEHLRPDMTGLAPSRLERLHDLSAGDLLVVDELLSGVGSPTELDTIQPATLYRSLQTRYFGARRILPSIRTLAALAQFELTPAASFFEGRWQPGERELASPLTTELFAPPRYQFLHSSLAEAVLRAQMVLEAGEARLDDASAEATAEALRGYWSVCEDHLVENLSLILRTRLKLMEPGRTVLLKAELLASDTTRGAIEARLRECRFGFLANCVDIVDAVESPAKAFYIGLINRRVRMLLAEEVDPDDAEPTSRGLQTLLQVLSLHVPSMLEAVVRDFGPEHFLRYIRRTGSLLELVNVLATPLIGEPLLAAVDESLLVSLIDEIIAKRSAVGTLSLRKRALAAVNPALLAQLERKIDAARFLDMILANGTLFELFMELKNSSPAFAGALLDELDDAKAEALLQATVTSGRSIATLDLTLRYLGEIAPDLLSRLEERFGPQRFVDLIAANGTVFELFSFARRVSRPFAGALLDRVDEQTAEALVAQTIARHRSIATLSLMTRALRDDVSLLGRLEHAIGPERLLRLICANGTVVDLFKILEHATPSFGERLLDHVDEDMMTALVAKTIAADRSVATLDLSMRDLHRDKPVILARLERSIGTGRFLRMLIANGTLIELLSALAWSTTSFREAVLDQLDSATLTSLVENTIVDRRSVESLHYKLRPISTDTYRWRRLQELIGVGLWWRLFATLGTFHSLGEIAGMMSDDFRERFLAGSSALDASQWSAIAARSFFRNVCSFAVHELGSYPPATQVVIEDAVAQTAPSNAMTASWVDLLQTQFPVESESDTLRILRDGYRRRLATVTVDDLCGLEFLEGVNAFACVWRERPDLRPALLEQMSTILGTPLHWPRKDGEMANLRLVLSALRPDETTAAKALALVDSIAAFLDRGVCLDLDTRPLFLLLWDMASLRHDRGLARSFDDVLPPALAELLLDVVSERAKRRGAKEEKLAQFMLAGLLAFLVPQMRTRVRTAAAPLRASAPAASKLALDQTFVPAFFALAGTALVQSSQPMHSPFVRLGLLAKSEEYDEIGPAIDLLRERVKRGSAWS